MDRVNIRIHIPQLLRNWNIKEFNRIKMDPGALKSGRRATIRKGELTTEAGGKRDVVVKLVNPQYASRSSDPEKRLELLVEYFKRESRIWTSLGAHPNLVPLLGFIPTLQTQAFPSLVMPFYSSGDLRNFVNEGNVSLKVKLQLMRDVANGLYYMHSRKPPAIHRDLKASNILIETVSSSAKEKYRARIADFGSTKLFEMENENTSSALMRRTMSQLIILIRPAQEMSGRLAVHFLRYFKKLIHGVTVPLIRSFCKEGVLHDQKVASSTMTVGH
ncbi:hypothetical protein ACEPAG_3779 [Sanghuangporus baumii]